MDRKSRSIDFSNFQYIKLKLYFWIQKSSYIAPLVFWKYQALNDLFSFCQFIQFLCIIHTSLTVFFVCSILLYLVKKNCAPFIVSLQKKRKYAFCQTAARYISTFSTEPSKNKSIYSLITKISIDTKLLRKQNKNYPEYFSELGSITSAAIPGWLDDSKYVFPIGSKTKWNQPRDQYHQCVCKIHSGCNERKTFFPSILGPASRIQFKVIYPVFDSFRNFMDGWQLFTRNFSCFTKKALIFRSPSDMNNPRCKGNRTQFTIIVHCV